MFDTFIQNHHLPNFRLKQLDQHFYQKLCQNFNEITTLPLDLRTKLSQEVEFSSLKLIKKLISEKQDTRKYLFARTTDQKLIETVLMLHQDGRNTICVSCMIGCPVGCTFCATGQMGFQGNLLAKEIVDQVLIIARELKAEDKIISNIVFMGMGEPLLNLKEVWQANQIFTSPEYMALSTSRITISTSGYAKQLEELTKLGYRGKLAISLHTAEQKKREQIMPIVAKSNPLPKLFKAIASFENITNKRITYEYILIKDFNDAAEAAEKLVKILQGRLAHVNLIPYNEVKGVAYQKSTRNRIFAFSEYLTRYHINNTIRVTMGADVNAACGQLAGFIPLPRQ
ncbi:MAG: 23S rRNA (adenine(2503)-C(2))-methyltransferase RlmN [bacterium]